LKGPPGLLRRKLLVVLLLGAFVAAGVVAVLDRRAAVEVAPRESPAAEANLCQKIGPSALATKYLENLHGVEIGASTQNSFYLKRAINVDFLDAPDNQQKGCPQAVVHIVALGDDLPFKDATLDYVISSHVVEHFYDPVKALKEWHRVIRPGGYIFTIAPHRDRTFDKHREPTPVQELLDRNAGRIRITDYARPLNQQALAKFGKDKLGHFAEVMPQILVPKKGGGKLDEGWAYYTEDDHHHWTVWRTADFVELARRLGLKVVEVQDVDDKVHNGFTVVIQK
jgi:SAM-dependent methyltransferase